MLTETLSHGLLSLGYKDFAFWQWAQSTLDLGGMRRYWQELMDPESPMHGPTRTAHPVLARTGERQAHVELNDADVVAGLRKLCRVEAATPFMALLVAYVVLLDGMAGRNELLSASRSTNGPTQGWPSMSVCSLTPC